MEYFFHTVLLNSIEEGLWLSENDLSSTRRSTLVKLPFQNPLAIGVPPTCVAAGVSLRNNGELLVAVT